ncbi:tetratricopeptide repeat protein [Streptomyces angustmyceticus]|uniref:tetratricopeptide repeat protein n=1 Tax=Streptomyces angustmyceticus TaxID=285578 RepID=UPI0037F33B25
MTGDNNRVHQVVLSAAEMQAVKDIQVPLGAGYLPSPAHGVFVGRSEELERLRMGLAEQGEAAVTQAQAVHGLGGIGKSALALHYAHRYRNSYRLVWWITATSPEQIDASLAALTVRLHPQWAATAQPDECTNWAIAWLQWHPGWLLVYDNVEDPEHLRPYLGTLSGGHHLATSRIAVGWHTIAPTLPLDVLAPTASVDLLCSLALGGQLPTSQQRQDAADLVADLGYLPLALEQAGAYLYQTGTDFATYRQRLGLMLDRAADGIDPERTVARIWDLTLEAITARNELAVTMLYTLAWIAPDRCGRTLLAPLAPNVIELDEALGCLRAYSMIHFHQQQAVSVHRLLQTVLRQRAATQSCEGEAPAGLKEAEEALAEAASAAEFAETLSNPTWELLSPHVIAIASNSPSSHSSETSTSLYCDFGDYFHACKQSARAIPLWEVVRIRLERLLGEVHPNTLTACNNLAGAYVDAGRWFEAISIWESVRVTCGQVLREDHPTTLSACNNLAYAYTMCGKMGKAIALYEVNLAERERALGRLHPDTLTARNNLAYAYHQDGDPLRAVPLYEETLRQSVEALGKFHPDSLNTRNNLAGAYEATGDIKRAIVLYREVVAQAEGVLGVSHTDTLIARANLACAYVKEGEAGKAIPELKEVLELCVEYLGEGAPYTLIVGSNLGYAYAEIGESERAVSVYEECLARAERAPGDDRSYVDAIRENLAKLQRGGE